ncbi:MAG TPA: DNA-3-methyladenine glycosylase I [Acidobacteriota bacterium]|nr:DNA-3-methyladenine glycosylase I [Acidobacteriota bacterium]
MSAEPPRCPWPALERSALYRAYHDEEWGAPVADDRTLFEFLVLEGAQAGLSWETILKKRARYREVFEGFEPEKVALFGDGDFARLLADPGIVRNRLKIAAAIENARRFLEVRREFGSFGAYVWRFVGGRPRINSVRAMSEVPARTAESDALSKDLARRGFKFVGSTICYAFMQAVGMVDDHVASCHRHGVGAGFVFPVRR